MTKNFTNNERLNEDGRWEGDRFEEGGSRPTTAVKGEQKQKEQNTQKREEERDAFDEDAWDEQNGSSGWNDDDTSV